jgi:membrane-bound ClpP family serine protease
MPGRYPHSRRASPSRSPSSISESFQVALTGSWCSSCWRLHQKSVHPSNSEGWVFVHGELWRAVLAFALEETDPRDGEPMIGFGRKVSVVGFDEGGVV